MKNAIIFVLGALAGAYVGAILEIKEERIDARKK